MPIKADKYEAAARYIGKYISKGIIRELVEKESEGKQKPPHSRRVVFSSGWRVANTRFVWLTDSADAWRRGVARFAEILGITSYEDLKEVCGKKWAYDNRDFIQSLGIYSTNPSQIRPLLLFHNNIFAIIHNYNLFNKFMLKGKEGNEIK